MTGGERTFGEERDLTLSEFEKKGKKTELYWSSRAGITLGVEGRQHSRG